MKILTPGSLPVYNVTLPRIIGERARKMQILQRKIKAFAGQAVDVILPPRCVVTGDAVERQGMIAPAAWQALDFIAEPFCALCGLPFDFEADAGALCVECLDERPPFASARAALKYNDASRALILGFKHADKTHIVRAFVPWLRRIGGSTLESADYILPVPLHYWRLVSRRYNQSALMAEALAQETKIPYWSGALKRIRATPSQGHLGYDERAKNVRGAFALHARYAEKIKGKNIILVDDVYTTGSTVRECAKALLKSGAGQVHVLALARVVRNV
jgi:ComF family protein